MSATAFHGILTPELEAVAARIRARPDRHHRRGMPRMPAAVESDIPYTEAELRVLVELAQGYGDDEIAARLCLAVGTVKTHVKHMLAKSIDIPRTRTALACDALRRGWVS
jgi:DNA-binding NarL/FixJ family response regulator